jgi:glycosyltransferase involved in cell wall biosynthesis
MRHVVLMSTFNGEAFIRPQLVSILEQLPANGRLIIRDDGSKDGTVASIRKFDDPRIEIIQGKNIGFSASFFHLLKTAPEDADIYMLSDQDDIWLPDKIKRATDLLHPYQKEIALYCSRAVLVTTNLKREGLTPSHRPPERLINALLQNIATGCTTAITPELRTIAINSQHLSWVEFHDWWLYVVATAFGTVQYDDQATLLYRQHSNNVIGMSSGWGRYIRIAKYLQKSNWTKTMNKQVWAFRKTYENQLRPEQIADIETIQNTHGQLKRSSLITNKNRLLQKTSDESLLRLMLAFDLRDAKIKEEQ